FFVMQTTAYEFFTDWSSDVCSSDLQHAAAGGDDLAVLQCGAGVEHLAVELGGVIQAFDHVTLGVVARVAAGGQHHAHGRTRVPGDRKSVVEGKGGGGSWLRHDKQQI